MNGHALAALGSPTTANSAARNPSGPGAEPSEAALLETRDLRVHFVQRGRRVVAVDGLSYRVPVGGTVAIIGESGCGKSVSCRALLGLLPATAVVAGSARFNGKELIGLSEADLQRHRGAGIAMVFQDFDRALNPTVKVGLQIGEAVGVHQRIGRDAARTRALELLHKLGVPAPPQRFEAYPHQLSGGMKQRVMLAIALASNPKLLIADEPTRSLDAVTQAQIMELLLDVQREFRTALLLISHDLRLAYNFAETVLVMRSGRSVEYGAARSVRQPSAPYTRALLNAIPGSESQSGRHIGVADWSSLREAPVLLRAENLTQEFYLRGETTRALSGVSFELRIGETLAVVGETGSGKSTLAHTLLQTLRPTSGSVFFRGYDLTRLRARELHQHRRYMQMIFQDPLGSLNPKWRVWELVEEPLLGYGQGDRRRRRRRVAELLDLVGLSPSIYEQRRARQLSGGQVQRVAIARALALNPSLIICDEAVSSLDVLIQSQILDLLARLRAELNIAYLFISHDLAMVKRFSHRVAVMHRGRLCEIGPAESVYRDPTHPYTGELISWMGTFEEGSRRDFAAVPVRADVPSIRDSNGGCVFQRRCSRAQLRCAVESPRLQCVREDHYVACHYPLGATSLAMESDDRRIAT